MRKVGKKGGSGERTVGFGGLSGSTKCPRQSGRADWALGHLTQLPPPRAKLLNFMADLSFGEAQSCHPDCLSILGGRVRATATNYLRLSGGMIPFIRRYSTS